MDHQVSLKYDQESTDNFFGQESENFSGVSINSGPSGPWIHSLCTIDKPSVFSVDFDII